MSAAVAAPHGYLQVRRPGFDREHFRLCLRRSTGRGLSGVVYGLLGYVWLYPLANPKVGFRLNTAIVAFMIGWLVVGYSGILDNIIGKMANDAHLIGLLTGIILGCGFGLLHRFTQSK